MKSVLLAAMFLSGEAVPDAFCSDVRALRDSAGESPAFSSLAGRNLNSLLGAYCPLGSPAPVASFCKRSLSPDDVTRDRVTARVLACLPEATVKRGAAPHHPNVITAGALRVRVDESGGPRSHVGRTVIFYFERAKIDEVSR